MSSQQIRIVPVLIGVGATQDLWQRLVREGELLRFVPVPEVALDASLEIPKAVFDAIPATDLIVFVLSGRRSSAAVERVWKSFGGFWGKPDRLIGALVVFQTSEQISKSGSLLMKVGAEVVAAEVPRDVADRLLQLVEEILSGRRLPVSAVANELQQKFSEKAMSNVIEPQANAPAEFQTEEASQEEAAPDDAEESESESASAQYLFSALDRSEFRGYAWSLLEAARRLGNSRPRPDRCSVRRLVTAILLSGLRPVSGLQTGTWLVSQVSRGPDWVRERIDSHYPTARRYEASLDMILKSDERPATQMTGALWRTIELARRLARESLAGNSDVRISARHLLGAIVSRGSQRKDLARFMRKFDLSAEGIRAGMIQDLPGWNVDDDVSVWRRILNGDDDEPDQEKGPDLEERGLPNYAADSTAGPDHIGITREVEAMASLVCAWSVEPPLSIGLFGEWGSGKSFFMQKMKDRVRQISSAARKSGKGQKEFGYYKNIVQVEFNAWHYVEGNLWASLVEHIFSNLRLEGIGEENVDSEDHLRSRLETLLGQVKEKTTEAEQKEKQAAQSSKEAQKAKEEAEAKARILEAEAEQARLRAKQAEEEKRIAEQNAAEKQRQADASMEERDSIGLKDIIDEVKESKDIRELVQKDLEKLGFTKERTESVQGLRDALKEASEAGTVLEEGWKILRRDGQRWRLLTWAVALPLLAAGLVWGGAWLTSQQNAPWLQTLIGWISAVATAIGGAVGFWKRYVPKLQPVLDVVARLKEKRAILEERVEKARQERAERAVALDAEARRKREEAATETKIAEQKAAEAEKARQEAREKQAEADRAAQAAQAARAEADRLRLEAEALMPDRRIAAFIQDRAGAKDYRQHLGVPALIRRDFEKLSAMFNTQRGEEKAGRDGMGADPNRNDLSIVNRIILYIDDLDRCPPEKVVEVLRAIHLLLAFPLFVVIVAVDARWVKRSLRDRFSLMLSSDEPKPSANAARKNESVALGQMATPDDYLEKIFQVPFWIRPLSPTACENLVNALTKGDVENEASDTDGEDDSAEAKQGKAEETKKVGAAGAQAASGVASSTNATATTPGAQHAGGASTAAGAGSTRTGNVSAGFGWSAVEPKPRTLQLTKDEREYMVELAPVIGRSPRSVKRFVNCYRLLKTALDKEDLDKASSDGTFRTTMLLLGMVTGLPDIAPALLADLRQEDKGQSPNNWAKKAEGRLVLQDHDRWPDLLSVIEQFEKSQLVGTIESLLYAADLVDRFSFSPVRSSAASE